MATQRGTSHGERSYPSRSAYAGRYVGTLYETERQKLIFGDSDMDPEPNRLRFGLAMIDEASQWTVSDTVSPMTSDSSSGGSSGGDSFLDSRQLPGALSTKDAVILIA